MKTFYPGQRLKTLLRADSFGLLRGFGFGSIKWTNGIVSHEESIVVKKKYLLKR